KPGRIAFERVSVRPRASRSEIAVVGAIGQGCGAALSVGIGGRSMFVEDAESSLVDPSGGERFAAACRRTYCSGTEVDSDVVRLVSGLAERVHRALHASKGDRDCCPETKCHEPKNTRSQRVASQLLAALHRSAPRMVGPS